MTTPCQSGIPFWLKTHTIGLKVDTRGHFLMVDPDDPRKYAWLLHKSGTGVSNFLSL